MIQSVDNLKQFYILNNYHYPAKCQRKLSDDHHITKRILKVSTVCEYFRRNAEVVISRMRASFLPSFIGKPQTPVREKQILFTYCSVRLNCSNDRAPRQLWNTVRYPFFLTQQMWNRPIFTVIYVTYMVKMPWVMEWWENGLESSTKFVITCMTSRGAAVRL